MGGIGRYIDLYLHTIVDCLAFVIFDKTGFVFFWAWLRVLRKWLENKLKPLSLNQYTVTDIFDFVNELPRDLNITPGDLLVSCDVSSLFTNVPLDETIKILADRAFIKNWFNSEYDLNISKQDLTDLLGVATKGQLFQFNGSLYEQIDGATMGSPLGPLLANVFMSSIEEKLDVERKLPPYYR